jgi:hypothetical protein
MWSERPGQPAGGLHYILCTSPISGGSHGAERLGKVTPRVWQVWIKEFALYEQSTSRRSAENVE